MARQRARFKVSNINFHNDYMMDTVSATLSLGRQNYEVEFHRKQYDMNILLSLNESPREDGVFIETDFEGILISLMTYVTGILVKKPYNVVFECSFEKKYAQLQDFFIEKVILTPDEEAITSFRLSEIDLRPLDYVKLKLTNGFGQVAIQSDGFVLYCAQTGEGKTYFALDNLPLLIKKFQLVVVLAYEITPQDYLFRLKDHFGYATVTDVIKYFDSRVIIEKSQNLKHLREKYGTYEKGSVAFIVDNIDNIPLESRFDGRHQANWLREFDDFIKEQSYFAIVLSQMAKRDKKAKKDFDSYDVGGSKERVDLARTVIYTYFDDEINRFTYKPLKYGSMIKHIKPGTPHVWHFLPGDSKVFDNLGGKEDGKK